MQKLPQELLTRLNPGAERKSSNCNVPATVADWILPVMASPLSDSDCTKQLTKSEPGIEIYIVSLTHKSGGSSKWKNSSR